MVAVPGPRSITVSTSPDFSDDDNSASIDTDIISRKSIGIIGGGVSGLAVAKAFSAQGHDVVIFERLPSMGGVWHANRSYPGIETQSPKDLYRFTDVAYPEECPEWPSGQDVLVSMMCVYYICVLPTNT